MGEHATQRLIDSVEGVEKIIDGLGFCLSKEGDLLSQWRGYADDATGVSIGFSEDYLGQLAKAEREPNKSGFTLQKMEYEYPEQKKLVMPTYEKVKELINKGAFRMPGPRSLLDTRSKEEMELEDKNVKKQILN